MSSTKNNLTEPFLKIPNEIIKISNSMNQCVLPTFLFLIKNKNMFNQIVTNINIIKNDFVQAKDSRSDKSIEFISALIILSSKLNLSSTNGNETHYEPFISFLNNAEILTLTNNNLDSQLKTVCTKNFIKNVKNDILTINVNFSNSDFSNDFTILTISEYTKIINFYSTKRKLNSHINAILLINMYIYIKMRLNKNQYINNKFNENDGFYTRTETLSPSTIMRNLKISRNTVNEYTKYLIQLKLIKKIDDSINFGYALY